LNNTVTGESVNLASRLKDKAPTGEIFISDSVYRALAERVDCSEVGELAIKGLAKPVRAWRLRAFREPARSGRQAFVGRTRELRQLEAALAQCRDTRRGRAIYLPFLREAATLSRMRSPMTSRSNWANTIRMLTVIRPMASLVLKDCVTETKVTPYCSNSSSRAEQAALQVRPPRRAGALTTFSPDGKFSLGTKRLVAR
jgi:hypothetical protein